MTRTYLVDSSAWIEYFRKTGGETDHFICSLVQSGADLATTEPVMAELLCGAKSEKELFKLEQLIDGLKLLTVDSRTDYFELARLFRSARAQGITVRKPFDCLIAAVALRNGAVLVHHDRDFDHLAEVVPRLRVQRHDLS